MKECHVVSVHGLPLSSSSNLFQLVKASICYACESTAFKLFSSSPKNDLDFTWYHLMGRLVYICIFFKISNHVGNYLCAFNVYSAYISNEIHGCASGWVSRFPCVCVGWDINPSRIPLTQKIRVQHVLIKC